MLRTVGSMDSDYYSKTARAVMASEIAPAKRPGS